MSNLVATLLSFGVIASALLIGAGLYAVIKQPEERKRGWLMFIAGAITLLNIWMWTAVPTLPPQ
ncbi:MAG: hypothetical protein INF91_09720 [Alphaproteobacteria bacterium]|nr:hypothetical protein [Alphaproteobacteria bacterium]